MSTCLKNMVKSVENFLTFKMKLGIKYGCNENKILLIYAPILFVQKMFPFRIMSSVLLKLM